MWTVNPSLAYQNAVHQPRTQQWDTLRMLLWKPKNVISRPLLRIKKIRLIRYAFKNHLYIWKNRGIKKEKKMREWDEDRMRHKLYWLSLFWSFYSPEWRADNFEIYYNDDKVEKSIQILEKFRSYIYKDRISYRSTTIICSILLFIWPTLFGANLKFPQFCSIIPINRYVAVKSCPNLGFRK